MNTFKVGLISVIGFIVGVLIYVIVGTTYISTGNIGFVKHTDGTVTEIGQGLKWTGWLVGVQEYSTYAQSLVLSDNPAESKTNTQWKIGTADQQELPVNTSLTWQLDVNKASELYQAVGGKDIEYIRETIVGPTMKSVVNQVTHGYSWNDIKGAKQGEIVAKINDELKKELDKYGITSRKFGLTHVGSAAGMEDGQKKLAESELAIKQAEQAKQRAQVDNETKILNAEASAKANKIEAEGLKAKADATSALLVQEEAIQKWNGQLPQTMAGGATPFINVK